MKTLIVAVIVVALAAGAGYYALPILVDRETQSLKTDIHEVRQRLQEIDKFVAAEMEARRESDLGPDADMQRVIRSVNALTERMDAVEKRLESGLAEADEASKKHMSATLQSIREMKSHLVKTADDVKLNADKINFNEGIREIKDHLLMAHDELRSRNTGNAKAEIEQVSRLLQDEKRATAREIKKIMPDIQTSIKGIMTDMETDVPAATNRVLLLWRELGRLVKGI